MGREGKRVKMSRVKKEKGVKENLGGERKEV